MKEIHRHIFYLCRWRSLKVIVRCILVNLRLTLKQRQILIIREFKIAHVAVEVPVVDKRRLHFAMFGRGCEVAVPFNIS